MNILHIIVGLDAGGAEIALKRLIESHQDSPDYGHSVISLADVGKIGQQLQSLGIEVQALNMRSSGPFSFLSVPNVILKLVRAIRHSSPDIVQTWMYHADLLGGIASRIAGNRHVIWGIHAVEINPDSRTTLMVRYICARLSHWVPHTIVCVAEASRKLHLALGYDGRHMEVVANGFDMSRLIATKAQRHNIRTQLGYRQKERVIGCVGRFDYSKHHENFVRAAGILAHKHLQLRFLMVGRNLDADNQVLARWISQTGHADRFTLLGERDDVPICLSAMDIFCLSSRTEAFPLVLGEAMAMGLPCVTTDVADTKLLLGDKGVVVPKKDSKALAAGLEKLLALTPDERISLGQQAKQRIQSKFTISHTRKRFEAIYNKIMNIDMS